MEPGLFRIEFFRISDSSGSTLCEPSPLVYQLCKLSPWLYPVMWAIPFDISSFVSPFPLVYSTAHTLVFVTVQSVLRWVQTMIAVCHLRVTYVIKWVSCKSKAKFLNVKNKFFIFKGLMDTKNMNKSYLWWYVLIILALRKIRQKDCSEFKSSLRNSKILSQKELQLRIIHWVIFIGRSIQNCKVRLSLEYLSFVN